MWILKQISIYDPFGNIVLQYRRSKQIDENLGKKFEANFYLQVYLFLIFHPFIDLHMINCECNVYSHPEFPKLQ